MELTVENGARILTIGILVAWLWLVGSDIRVAYPPALVEAYALPLTRFVLLAGVLALTSWCPTAGILSALAFVLLGADVLTLTSTSKPSV
jgi:hypothetical protein